jgi:hypothetical protein
MSGTGLAASDPVRGRESRRSCGRGAETAAGLEAGPVLVAVWQLPGLLIQVTTGGSSSCRRRGLEQRCRYHQTLARSRGAANVQPSQMMPCIMAAVATMRPSGRAPGSGT